IGILRQRLPHRHPPTPPQQVDLEQVCVAAKEAQSSFQGLLVALPRLFQGDRTSIAVTSWRSATSRISSACCGTTCGITVSNSSGGAKAVADLVFAAVVPSLTTPTSG